MIPDYPRAVDTASGVFLVWSVHREPYSMLRLQADHTLGQGQAVFKLIDLFEKRVQRASHKSPVRWWGVTRLLYD